jgi:hypothetical protein
MLGLARKERNLLPRKNMLRTWSIAVSLVALAATLPAQTPTYPDTFKVGYFSTGAPTCSGPNNAVVCNPPPAAPDTTVYITNVGTQTGTKADPSGDLCAMIYVFEPDQQLAECCGCSITPDGLLTLSVKYNLTNNSLTGAILTNGAIKIVSSTWNPPCNAAKPAPAAGIRAWITHVQDSTPDVLTETPFSDATLSAGELSNLAAECKILQTEGSGAGLCMCESDL